MPRVDSTLQEVQLSAPDFTDTPLSGLLTLTGRSAVVTGGAKGLGRAIGRRLAQAGAVVYLADVDEDALREAAGAIGTGAVPVSFDATQPEHHEALANRVRAETGALDIWVNNAGIYPFTDFLDMTPDDWRAVTRLNLDGVFYGSSAAARAMAPMGRGVIVNLSSTAGYGAEGGGIAHYASTKHAVRGLTKSLALELGPKGIRAIAIAPTLIETPGTLDQKETISRGLGVDDAHEAFAQQIPLRRIGLPDDVARVVLFCVSDLAGFVSGDTILVDGGLRSQ